MWLSTKDLTGSPVRVQAVSGELSVLEGTEKDGASKFWPRPTIPYSADLPARRSLPLIILLVTTYS